MIYLLLAILCSAMISLLMRLSENKITGRVSMLAANYITCFLLGGFCTGFRNMLPAGVPMGETFGLAAVNGLLYLLGFVFLQMNIRRNGVVLSSTFMKLGLLVPMVISVVFFGEMPAPMQIVGFLLAIGAIVLMNTGGGEGEVRFKAGLILVLLAGGGCDAMAKVYEEIGNPALSDPYLFYSFGAALILCAGLMLYKKESMGKWELLFGALVGVPNYFTARFLLRSLEDIPAVIVYPTYSVATILVVTLAGMAFFKERLGKRQWLAMGVILGALVLLNI